MAVLTLVLGAVLLLWRWALLLRDTCAALQPCHVAAPRATCGTEPARPGLR